MNSIDERDIDPITEMTRIAQDILDLPSRRFKESYRSPKPGKLIYESEWCRISLVWGGWEYGSGNTMHIFYGRLHAPNEKARMMWNGEECHCWHELRYILHFLDGRTPAKAAELNYSHPIVAPFYQEELEQRYKSQPEWLAQMHLAIWQYYGQPLFDLFDLRQPALWQQYQQFLKDVYDITGRPPKLGPPKDKVC
jgi:hypothetical protein